MLYAGVYEYEFIALWVEREVFVFQSLAIETDKAALLSEDGSELVHDTAVYSDIVMFGSLADLGKLEFVDSVREEVVDGESDSAFECCR